MNHHKGYWTGRGSNLKFINLANVYFRKKSIFKGNDWSDLCREVLFGKGVYMYLYCKTLHKTIKPGGNLDPLYSTA